MKGILFAGIALALATIGSANAADMAVKARIAPPPPPAVYSWTGCYGGGHVGGLWARKNWTLQFPDPVTPIGSHDANSWLGGLQAGCDYQFANRFVIGIQGDYAWTDATGSHIDVVDATRDQTRVRSLATVTLRAGYAWDRFLGYVKGGGAWESDRYDRFDLVVPNLLVGSARETRGGWTVGVGGEYAFTNYASAFAEYNYYDFGTRTLTFLTPAGAFNDNISISERKSVVRVGLNFRWSPAGPVVAKY
jgi:outer membrane immunogenic protein